MKEVKINTEFIKLDAFLKWAGIVTVGSEAKLYITAGEVRVNGDAETQRGKKIRSGDTVEFQGETYKVL